MPIRSYSRNPPVSLRGAAPPRALGGGRRTGPPFPLAPRPASASAGDAQAPPTRGRDRPGHVSAGRTRCRGRAGGWPGPRVPGAGSGRQRSPAGRRQPRGPAPSVGFGRRPLRVLGRRRSRAPWPARPLLLVTLGRGAGGCGRRAEGGSEGAGALCAEQAGGGRGLGRHVHGGPLLCGERVSVAEGFIGEGGGAACPHLPALLAGGGGETS